MFSKIKKISLAVILIFAGFTSTMAQNATSWELDKAHSSVNFSINHFFSAVTGKFSTFSGKFNFDPKNPAGGQMEFTVNVNSVNTDDAKRDNHLQSGDFFDAKKFPIMFFKSTRIEKKSDTEFTVYGKLTIKDVTKEIALPFKIKGEMEHPMKKGTLILGLSTDVKINRTEFGVGTGSWAATMVVGDEVAIHIPLELNRTK